MNLNDFISSKLNYVHSVRWGETISIIQSLLNGYSPFNNYNVLNNFINDVLSMINKNGYTIYHSVFVVNFINDVNTFKEEQSVISAYDIMVDYICFELLNPAGNLAAREFEQGFSIANAALNKATSAYNQPSSIQRPAPYQTSYPQNYLSPRTNQSNKTGYSRLQPINDGGVFSRNIYPTPQQNNQQKTSYSRIEPEGNINMQKEQHLTSIQPATLQHVPKVDSSLNDFQPQSSSILSLDSIQLSPTSEKPQIEPIPVYRDLICDEYGGYEFDRTNYILQQQKQHHLSIGVLQKLVFLPVDSNTDEWDENWLKMIIENASNLKEENGIVEVVNSFDYLVSRKELSLTEWIKRHFSKLILDRLVDNGVQHNLAFFPIFTDYNSCITFLDGYGIGKMTKYIFREFKNIFENIELIDIDIENDQTSNGRVFILKLNECTLVVNEFLNYNELNKCFYNRDTKTDEHLFREDLNAAFKTVFEFHLTDKDYFFYVVDKAQIKYKVFRGINTLSEKKYRVEIA